MFQPEVRETTLEEAQKLDPNKIKYMTFLDGSVAIVDSDTEDKRNKNIPEQIKVNKEIQNQNKENGQYIQNKDNNNIYNENLDNNKIDNTFKEKNIDQKFEIEINNNSININNNNINNETQKYEIEMNNNNLNYDNNMNYNYDNRNQNQYEESEDKESEIPTLVKVIKTDDNFIKYNELPQQKIIYNNQNIYESNPLPPQIQPQINSENNNFHIKNEISYENQDKQNQIMKSQRGENQLLYNNYENIETSKNNNSSINRDNFKDSGLVKNNNYKVLYKNENFLNNNFKTEKAIFIEDKNIENSNNKKEKTIFIEDKSVNNYYQNNNKEKMYQEIKEEILDKGYFSNINTKVINAIPIENYEQNQKYITTINNIQKNQRMNPETLKSKIFIATDTNSSNIIPKQKEGNSQKIPQNEENNQNLNKNQNLIPIKLNQINYSGPDIENIIIQKQNNQQFENKNNNESNNILYSKVEYGNDNNIQKKLKKKKKKRIYVRMKKPIIQQHFDIQIIKNIDKEEICQKYQKYHEQANKCQNENINQLLNINQNENQILNQNQISNFQKRENDNKENKVPPVVNKYQNPNTFNSPYYLIQNEFKCNCNIPYKQYHPIISDNVSTIHSYSNEENNNKYKYPCNQKQTIINITPMRTMKQLISPYKENSYNIYDKRLIRNERNNNFITFTPNNYKNHKNQIEIGNNDDENYYNYYSNKRRRNNKYIHIYDDKEEMNENNNSNEEYNRGQRIARDDY